MRTLALGRTDVGAGLEDGHDLRVHLDHPVLLVEQLLVPDLDLRMDPRFKWLAYNGVDDIDDILSW